jgi:tetratricopeptide (TPR) repeat protein
MTQDSTPPTTQINTDGGAAFEKDVKADEVVGRDKIVNNNYYGSSSPPSSGPLQEQLPPQIKFAGREQELQHILGIVSRAEQNERPVIVITGMPGIGKSAFAVQAAYALKEKFKDAQLYMDLYGHDLEKEPRNSEQALLQCLQALKEKDLPDVTDSNGLRNRYMAFLRGKAALVLLENARSDRDLELLQPPEGCILLVTSRQNLTTGELIPLQPLSNEDATQMLRQVCPRLSEDEAGQLARLCDYLPKALQATGKHLKLSRSKSPQKYIESLQRDGLRNVEELVAHFEQSYGRLPPVQQAALRALSFMPTEFDRDAGLAIIGTQDGMQDEDILDDLFNQNLLKYDETKQRFSWSTLLRAFVQDHDRADVKESNAIISRYAEYYTEVADNANQSYLKGSDAAQAALDQFRSDRLHIEQAFQSLNQLLTQPARQVVSLVYALKDISDADDSWDKQERIEWLKTQWYLSHIIKDSSAEKSALAALGKAYEKQSQLGDALDAYRRALSVKERTQDTQQQDAEINFEIGKIYYRSGNFKEAVAIYESALKLYQDSGNKEGQGSVCYNLSLAHQALESLDRALDCARQSLTFWQAVQSPHTDLAQRQVNALTNPTSA